MKYKKLLHIHQGEKVGNHILIEHINEHTGKVDLPMAIFECGLCHKHYKTTITSAYHSKSCGCSKKRLSVSVSDVLILLKKDPFIKIREIENKLSISFASAAAYRVKAFKQL